jgi:hypothetical protein
MATWAYPPLPAEQINREADAALVRNPLLGSSDHIVWCGAPWFTVDAYTFLGP